MKAEDIRAMVDGLSEPTKEVIRELKTELTSAITQINAHTPYSKITPEPHLIFNAMRLCSIENTKIVLIGQDPYPKKGVATGLSFAVSPTTTTPGSLQNIFKCLKKDYTITCKDLTIWARRGVLLLNAALTTHVSNPNMHADYWKDFTDKLISRISARGNIVFILLGKFAQSKEELVEKDRGNTILKWGHPSGVSSYNQKECPQNFKYCDCFRKAEQITGISWNLEVKKAPKTDLIAAKIIPDIVERPDGCVWIFTDGGASNNGADNCLCSFAYVIVSDKTYVCSGRPDDKQSNNVGELTAILQALLQLEKLKEDTTNTTNTTTYANPIYLVTDSKYAINCITDWIHKWEAKNLVKENMDLIRECRDLCADVTFIHINSHQKEPSKDKKVEWFKWRMNHYVDELCQQELK